MEALEVINFKVYWGCDIETEIDSLGEGKETLREYLKANTTYDKEAQESIFNNADDYFQTAYSVLRPFVKKIPGPISFDFVYYAMNGGQDMYGRSEWSIESYDEDEDYELPEDLIDIIDVYDFVYPSDWFAEWYEEHKEETEEWDEWDGFDFGADRWHEFADAFPEAEKEFFAMLEDL